MTRRRDDRRPVGDAEGELAARAAWLYHVGGMLQAEVAAALDLSLFKVNRLIAMAAERGIVRVLVDGPIAQCVGLEHAIVARFGLSYARVVPDVDGQDSTAQSLGMAGAAYLHAALEAGHHRIIGVGHGRTLAAVTGHLPARKADHVEFVALLGSLPSRFGAHPFEVVYTLADRTASLARLITVPLYANDSADRAVLLRQDGVHRAFETASRATLCLLGIASVADKERTDLRMQAITAADLAEVRVAGAVSEILGYYYDAQGRKLDVSLHERVIAYEPEALRGREVVAVAGGGNKRDAILSILRAEVVSGLITTEATARGLLAA